MRGAGSTASLLVCTRRTILTLRQRVFLVRFDARRTLREVQCDLLCAETQSANQPFWLGRGMAAEPSWRFFALPVGSPLARGGSLPPAY